MLSPLVRQMPGSMSYEGAAGGGPASGGATQQSPHALQQKMHRQRQLALERQRSTARKQLGAGVIASANPLLQSSPMMKGPQWDKILPEGLSKTSPTNRGLSHTNESATAATAPSSPTKEEELKAAEAKQQQSLNSKNHKNSLDDLLGDLAEEVLLDDPTPASVADKEKAKQAAAKEAASAKVGAESPIDDDFPLVPPSQRGGRRNQGGGPGVFQPDNGRSSPSSQSGLDAWGGGALQAGGPPGFSGPGRGVQVESVDELQSFGGGGMGNDSHKMPSGRVGRRQMRPAHQPTTVLGEDGDDGIQAFNTRSDSPTAARRQPVGQSWDLSVEAPKEEGRRGKKGGSSWWPFNKGEQQETIKEEVTAIQGFDD